MLNKKDLNALQLALYKRDITQKEAAQVLGIGLSTMYRRMRNVDSFRIHELKKLWRLLEITAEEGGEILESCRQKYIPH